MLCPNWGRAGAGEDLAKALPSFAARAVPTFAGGFGQWLRIGIVIAAGLRVWFKVVVPGIRIRNVSVSIWVICNVGFMAHGITSGDSMCRRREKYNEILAIKNGDNRARTCDLLHVKQTLSQLSYISIQLL